MSTGNSAQGRRGRRGPRTGPALERSPPKRDQRGRPLKGKGPGVCRPQGPCRPFCHLTPAGSGLARVRLPEARSGNQHGRAVIGPKWCLFFAGWGGGHREVGSGPGAFRFSPAPPPADSIHAPPRRPQRAWRVERDAESTRGIIPPSPTQPRTVALAKAQALLFLFFFISLFHIHISHSMEKPESQAKMV